MKVKKRNKKTEDFDGKKIMKAINSAFKSCGTECEEGYAEKISEKISKRNNLTVEGIQDEIEETLMKDKHYEEAKSFIIYREKKKNIRNYVSKKRDFIDRYKESDNTANATIDDNSNVRNKNIGILNSEIHKEENIDTSRGMIMSKLMELYPDFNSKQYIDDLQNHIIYKHDESSFAGPIAPYCCSISMYPFLLNGLKDLGGLSAKPKNLDSYCGMLVNLVFAVSAQFLGAVALPEALVFFDYFARKKWGEDYYIKYNNPDVRFFSKKNSLPKVIGKACKSIKIDKAYSFMMKKIVKERTIEEQIHQYFQQIVYSINQPAAARGMQSAFVNFSYFDKEFFYSMFENFKFPDGSVPKWDSVNWIQKNFMTWFNAEREKTMIPFPVESFAMIYKDGDFSDKENADFVAKELSEGHSFFVYVSDTADSLSSCCFSKDTPVMVKINGKCEITPISEVYDKQMKGLDKLEVFNSGKWSKCKAIELPNRRMYEIKTENGKTIVLSDNHLNPTSEGDKKTSDLKSGDLLLENTNVNEEIGKEIGLTYSEGFCVGSYMGDEKANMGIVPSEKSQMHMQIGANEMFKRANGKSVIKLTADDKPSIRNVVEFIDEWTSFDGFSKKISKSVLEQGKDFLEGIYDGWKDSCGGLEIITEVEENAHVCESIMTFLGIASEITKRSDGAYSIKKYFGLASRNGSKYVRIKNISEKEYLEKIYCFEMEDEEDPYFTLPNGITTHNCRLKNKIRTKEFSFTNGNIGVETGSKSVITLNLNRIIQNWVNDERLMKNGKLCMNEETVKSLDMYISEILGRVYKYHTAYNSYLNDMYKSDLLPVYKAGFISLKKQYMTIGINGLNQAAEFLGFECNDNPLYKKFCQTVFSIIKRNNVENKTKEITYNCEMVPAESLAVKNYNWDKNDGYWVPNDTNLYASYVFKPNDKGTSVLEKIRLHGKEYIGDYLDGGSACHINLEEHLSKAQYEKLLKYAAVNGCQYFTFNIPNSECEHCGYISKHPIKKCPKCGSTNISLWDRVIGYLSKIKNWSEGRQIEQKIRVYTKNFSEND